MFDQFPDGLAELQDFFLTHSEGLQNASLLLGGKPELKATADLIDDICTTTVLTRRLKTGLLRLLDLLTLQHIHDPKRPESAYFADLDPSAPYVEDICLLSEAYFDVLLCLDAVDEIPLPLAA
ncbi:hypothetical protein RA27_00365 [Ruegeria sp. ANG-R]|uniref:hypothetical protein n=1 Tax=Ruegeria sp. ANG-R TaxID=1577903 RepID=UPI00057E8966|nr:hypothetical protein [Ruegeria sp. ANG-R]KIC41906.1 hypothetical protein RA27_00365 [Ruegeria sp. ANG-R]